MAQATPAESIESVGESNHPEVFNRNISITYFKKTGCAKKANGLTQDQI